MFSSRLVRLSSCTAHKLGSYHSSGKLNRIIPVLLCSRRQLSTHVEAEDIDDPGLYDVILPPDPPVWGVSNIIRRTVPEHIMRPPYALLGRTVDISDPGHGDPHQGDGRIELGNESERRLRSAAAFAKRVLSKAEALVKVGITTDEIDATIHDFIIKNNAYPSPLGYSGFPRSCCTSVNNVIAHGIPNDRKLVDGDIVNIDITVFLDGYHGDTSKTFCVGNVDSIGRSLVQASSDALESGIRACGPGVPFKKIGAAIHDFASTHNFSVSEGFTGHGIGTVFHRPPWIYHVRNDEPGVMLPGHCFTIEPALIVGRGNKFWVFPDGWTASTMDGCRSAQAEHMVLITETGVDILTR